MTPNPTARPFVVGALLFLTLISLWPGRVQADRDAPVRRSPLAATSPHR
jgi:hypothetical protein